MCIDGLSWINDGVNFIDVFPKWGATARVRAVLFVIAVESICFEGKYFSVRADPGEFFNFPILVY